MNPKAAKNRKVYSISRELLKKSREAALAAVQTFNNPQITFKSEIFIILMNIAWMYLLHSHYRKLGIEYRYFTIKGKKRIFDKTSRGAHKYWELERCLNEKASPIDKDTANNLRFLIGVRHEIEHRMTNSIDSSFTAKFQACCLNYNEYIKKLFGDEYGIESDLSISLQFAGISKNQAQSLPGPTLPTNIQAYVSDFETNLSEDEFNNPKFSYRLFFLPKLANKKGQADEVIEFIKADSEIAKNVNAAYTVIKETEANKYLPGQVIDKVKEAGFPEFEMYDHTLLWKAEGAKDPAKKYGVQVSKYWLWYQKWVDFVIQYCTSQGDKYK